MCCIKNKSKFIIVLIMLLLVSNTNVYAMSSKIQTNILNLVPIRQTFEKLGFTVVWNQENRNVELINEDHEIILTTNKDEVDINNKIYEMEIINGLSYIDLDCIKDFGFEYEYIDSSNIAVWKKLNIGSKAPVVESETIKEEDLNLLNENNKAKMLFFWATWCPYCTEYIKEINEISNNDSLDFEIVAVNIDGKDNRKEVEKYLESNLLNTKNILDPNRDIFNYYNPKGIPISYIIDTNGIIVDLIIGPIPKEEIINKFNGN